MAKFCTNCGAPLPDNRKFCTECGTPLAVPAAESPAAQETTSSPAEPDSIFGVPAESVPEVSAPEFAASQPSVQQPVYHEPAPAPAVSQPAHQAAPAPMAAPQPAYQAPAPAYGDAAPPKGSKYEPITAGGYIGIMLLMCIPVIGLILTIIWACGGCRKVNKRSLARATLIMMAVSLVLSLIIGIAGKAVFNSVLKEIGISSSQTTGLLGGLDSKEESSGGLLSGLTGSKEKEEDPDSGLLGGLGALAGLTGGSESGNSEVTNSDIEELEELGKLLDSLGALSGEEDESSDSGLSGLIDGAIEANRDAEAANDGWPKSLRPYPGGTATAVASYRTEISGTTEEEMLAYIEDLRGDGFVYTDFYDFGMSEQEMLDFAGWWATDGEIYLSISYYEGTVTIDHTYELPDLDSYF